VDIQRHTVVHHLAVASDVGHMVDVVRPLDEAVSSDHEGALHVAMSAAARYDDPVAMVSDYRPDPTWGPADDHIGPPYLGDPAMLDMRHRLVAVVMIGSSAVRRSFNVTSAAGCDVAGASAKRRLTRRSTGGGRRFAARPVTPD